MKIARESAVKHEDIGLNESNISTEFDTIDFKDSYIFISRHFLTIL